MDDSPSASPALPALPTAVPPPPMFGQNPQGKKPQRKSMQPSFLGTGSMPQAGQLGNKTLLGGAA